MLSVNEAEVELCLQTPEGEATLVMSPDLAAEIACSIADSVLAVRDRAVNPKAGVTNVAASSVEVDLRSVRQALGMNEKFIITAKSEKAKTVVLRLSPDQVRDLVSHLAGQMARRERRVGR